MAGERASVEELVDQALEALLSLRPGTVGAAAALLDQATAEIAILSPSPAELARLRDKLTAVQALAGQAAGFHRGIEQTDADAFVGYTPCGLERAL